MTLENPPPPSAPEPAASDFNKWADHWYYTVGINTIPVVTRYKTAKKGFEWKIWQYKPIPEDLFAKWKSENAFADGIGIIPGRSWRGPHQGEYFIFIDCDNAKAIQEFCTRNGVTTPLEVIASKYIVEQHKDNPNKCHVYFFSELPFPKRSSDSNNREFKPEEQPAFEVKGEGSHGIAYCTPSIHQNGHHYEIIGTSDPVVLDTSAANEMKQHLDSICKKYGLHYLEYDDSGSGKSKVPMEELYKEDCKIYKGQNRHEGLLRLIESLLTKNIKHKLNLPPHIIKDVARVWNQRQCVPPLDDSEFERQWNDANKFIEMQQQQQQQQDSPESSNTVSYPQIEPTPDLTRELTYEEVAVILSTSIKKDKPAKVISFCGMLLAQTNEDQLNTGYQAESSSGKSWIPLELSAYFPENEVQLIASASPTAFFHDGGNWDKDRKVLLVDLEHKILIFIDQPHFQLQEKLRPLLSHDRKELIYKITDKSQKHGLRTKNVILRGYPSTFFCTTNLDPDEQEKTRMLFLSPETDQNKLYESLELTALRKGNYEAYSKRITQDPKRTWLKNRIYLIRQWGIREVILPADGRTVFERFIKEHPYLQPRHQRDFPRIFNLIKSHALLNCFNREKNDEEKPDTIVATEADIEAGFKLYKEIERSNELGVSPYIHAIYEDVMVPLLRKLAKDSEGEAINGLSKEDIMKRHYEVRHKPLSPDMLKSILLQLESVGLIKQEPDPNDRRKTLVYPTVSSNIS